MLTIQCICGHAYQKHLSRSPCVWKHHSQHQHTITRAQMKMLRVAGGGSTEAREEEARMFQIRGEAGVEPGLHGGDSDQDPDVGEVIRKGKHDTF